MNETRLAWRVGIVVICAAIIFAILILLLGEGWQSQYTVYVDAPTAPNVTTNTPVRKNGILIGRVADVENQDRSVRLTLKIQSDEAIYGNEVCKIGTASFLGDAVLDIVPGDQPIRGEPITDRAVFTNVAVERNPVELLDVAMSLEGDVREALESVKRAGDTVDQAGQEIASLANQLQEAVGDDNGDLRQFMQNTRELAVKAETAIDNFNTLMVNVNEFAGDAEMRESIREGFRKLPELIEEINTAVTDTRETINGFRKVGDSAEENLANLTEFTRALGEEGPEILERLNKGIGDVEGLMSDIRSVTEGLGNSNGSLAKLLNDSELYDNLNETVYNIRRVSVQLEPLMNDVRFAVDGIARDPGQLGGRGLLDRRPAFSGPKGNAVGSGIDWQPIPSPEPIQNRW